MRLLGIVFSFFVLLGANPVLAASASSLTVPLTCDPDFWDVLKARAWEGGEREMTQNRNIIAKSDSTLSFCFDDYMDHLAWYADRAFPNHPNESGGPAINAYVAIQRALGSADPALTQGLDMNSVLEILILDTMVSGVSRIPLNADDGAALACPRAYYLEEGFGNRFLGDRSTTSALPASSVSDTLFNCQEINTIWREAKCYTFAKESERGGGSPHHDDFRLFTDYVDAESGGNDYRIHIDNHHCLQSSDYIPSIVCHYYFHGSPSGALAFWPWTGTTTLLYHWTSSHPDANPTPGSAGAMDAVNPYAYLTEARTCTSVPAVPTGITVRKFDGTTYPDAVCASPGCWYNGSRCQ